MVKGMVFRRDVEGDVRSVNQSKIAIYSCPLECLQTETKGTVLLHTAEDLKEFSKGEENQMERVCTIRYWVSALLKRNLMPLFL